MPNTRKHKKYPHRQPGSTGWLTTDGDEIGRRRLRGANESFRVDPQAQGHDFFADYRVQSDNGRTYRVEIRSLLELINSCD